MDYEKEYKFLVKRIEDCSQCCSLCKNYVGGFACPSCCFEVITSRDILEEILRNKGFSISHLPNDHYYYYYSIKEGKWNAYVEYYITDKELSIIIDHADDNKKKTEISRPCEKEDFLSCLSDIISIYDNSNQGGYYNEVMKQLYELCNALKEELTK